MHYFLRHSVCYLNGLGPKVSGKAIVRLSGRNGVGCWKEPAQLALYNPLIFTSRLSLPRCTDRHLKTSVILSRGELGQHANAHTQSSEDTAGLWSYVQNWGVDGVQLPRINHSESFSLSLMVTLISRQAFSSLLIVLFLCNTIYHPQNCSKAYP